MRRSIAAVAAVLVLTAPAGLAAQDLATLCTDVQKADVGDWAQYEIDSPQGSGTMRFAMLPKGAASDAGQWFEMAMDVNAQKVILQVLVQDFPFEAADIDAIVIKPGAQPAMRVPDAALAQARRQVNLPMGDMSEGCLKSELLGSGSIEVPAGTFDAHHLKPAPQEGVDPGEVWISTAVPFGMLKAESAEGSMVLVAKGDGATSSITETPQAMPAMPGMGGP